MKCARTYSYEEKKDTEISEGNIDFFGGFVNLKGIPKNYSRPFPSPREEAFRDTFN